MSAWTELATTGRFGADGAILLYDVAGAVARGGNYPPPSGGERWRMADIRELAHTIMADPEVPFFAELRANSVDETTLRVHLHRMVQRRLADNGRQNPKGALIRRLRQLLKDAQFERVGRNGYRLAGGPPATGGVFHPAALHDAADRMPITARTFGPDAKRRSPVATDASVVDVCTAILGVCPHPLPISELADVVARRIGMPLDEAEPSFDSPRPPPEPVAPDVLIAAGARVDAERVWAELDGEERRAIPVLPLDAREAAGPLGVGKTKANALQKGALTAIASALGFDNPPGDLDGLRALLSHTDVRPIMLALDRLARDRLPYDGNDDEGAAR